MRAKRGTTIIIGLAMGSLLAGPAMAQSDTPPENHALYGISGENDELMRYDFVDGGYESVGAVRMHDTGQQLKGIRAMAHIPRMTNLFGFWIDPDTGLTRLVFINANTAEAAVVGTDLGDGPITGAAAAPETAEEPAPDEQTSSQTISEYTLYAVQWRLPTVDDDDALGSSFGTANINPNNSSHSSFKLLTDGGTVLRREDLKNAEVADDGTLYEGGAQEMRMQPKGNGNQNSMYVDGYTYELSNGTTYHFDWGFDVRLYNDRVKNGKAMGHWWVEVSGDTVYIDEGADDSTQIEPHLIEVDLHQEREQRDPARKDQKKDLMALTAGRQYDSLAARENGTFYATAGHELYVIDPANGTEELVGSWGHPKVKGLAFAGTRMFGFYNYTNEMIEINTSDASRSDGRSIGMDHLETVEFIRDPDEPFLASYD
jgi:hypothetical protein